MAAPNGVGGPRSNSLFDIYNRGDKNTDGLVLTAVSVKPVNMLGAFSILFTVGCRLWCTS